MRSLQQNRNLRTVCLEVFVLLASAFVYAMAFPGFVSKSGFGFIAFLALIPVFAVIRNTTYRLVWAYGFVFGFVYYLFFNYWLTTFHPLAILIVPIIKGGEMIALFLALKAASSITKKYAYILEAVIWVSYAYLSESWFAGYPYGTICYAIYRYLPLMQLASITGPWGIIFLMIFPQSFLGNYLSDRLSGSEQKLGMHCKAHLIPLCVYAGLCIFWVVFGFTSEREWKNAAPDKEWRVAAIQHNHDSWKGGYQTYKINFNNLRRLSLEALQEDPDIIIWSETAFIPSVAWHTTYHYDGNDVIDGNENTAKLVEEFIRFGEDLPIPLLTGNPEGVLEDSTKGPVNEDGTLNRADYNTVILFKDGKIDETYRKQHLVPFTEHFPYKKTLPWLYNILLANDYNWWLKGDESVVFTSPEGVTFSTPICFEDVFGYLPAAFVRQGANVIVNMTNDSWSGAESAEMQHAQIAAMRSIETRKSTIRGTNSGISCLITPYGSMEEIMPPFKMDWHIYNVPVYETAHYGETFYVRHTDLFAKIAVWISLGFLFLGIAWKIYGKVKEGKR